MKRYKKIIKILEKLGCKTEIRETYNIFGKSENLFITYSKDKKARSWLISQNIPDIEGKGWEDSIVKQIKYEIGFILLNDSL